MDIYQKLDLARETFTHLRYLLDAGGHEAHLDMVSSLPENAPDFPQDLSYDLLAYGYALLNDGLDILKAHGDPAIARKAFEGAAGAIESVIAKGEHNTERDFHRFIAGRLEHPERFGLRMDHHLADRLDGRVRHPGRVELLLPMRPGLGPEDRFEPPVHLLAVLHPLGVGREPLVLQPFGMPERAC